MSKIYRSRKTFHVNDTLLWLGRRKRHHAKANWRKGTGLAIARRRAA